MIQKILKPIDQVVIFVDFREKKTSIIDTIEEMGAKVKLISLKVGDYIVSDRVCVERKFSEDFINSIIDGRLFKQAEELKDNFEKPILIIEGNYFRETMNQNAIKAAIASIILDYEIPIIMTRDEEETARTIFWLAKREQRETKRPVGIKGKKKPKNLKDLQENILSSFPGVSVVLSKRILKQFKTIRDFANAEESDLIKIDGIGKILAKRLCKVLREKY